MNQKNLRCRRQSQFARRTPHNTGAIGARGRLLALLHVLGQLRVITRINHHDLAELAMRARSAIQEHWRGARDGHVESADVGLAIDKRDVAAVHAAFHGRAGGVGRRLRDGVVAV